jgi:hypothetical protein
MLLLDREEPFSVAVVVPTPVAADVVAVGAAFVVNCWTDPNPVPTEFVAIAQ